MKNTGTICSTPRETATSCANYVIERMTTVLQEQEYFALAISGGSTPKLMFNHLADQYPSHEGWRRTKIFWVDERCVPQQHPESNFGMTNESLLQYLETTPLVFPVDGFDFPGSGTGLYKRTGLYCRGTPCNGAKAYYSHGKSNCRLKRESVSYHRTEQS